MDILFRKLVKTLQPKKTKKNATNKIDAESIPSDIVIIINDNEKSLKNFNNEIEEIEVSKSPKEKKDVPSPHLSNKKSLKRTQKIKQKLDIENDNKHFIIKNRNTNKYGQDDFELILENMEFCKLTYIHIHRELYSSDFVIFINDTKHISEGNPYRPMCIGFINLYDEGKTPYLYISTFCSNENYGKCATRLMNHIKYIGKVLNYKEIRLSSVQKQHTLEFYKKNGFINLFEDGVEYDHIYNISEEDAKYKLLQPIQGNVAIAPKSPTIKSSRYGKVMYTDSEGFTRKKKSKSPSVHSKSSKNKKIWRSISSNA